jgi:hypothetical protein
LEQLIGVAPGMSPADAEAMFESSLQSNSAHAEQQAALRATLGLPTLEFELLDDAGRLNSISRGWKAVLHGLEAEAPLLLVLDDLQWADPFSLQLLDQIIDFIPGHAVVLCFLARNEFQHSWASRSYYHQLRLGPLAAEDSAALARALLKKGSTINEAEVVARAEGNPFYLTELAQAAAQRGEAQLPATIEGVILERIDRLEKKSRQILELASVIGREFPERLLREVADLKDLESQLHRLRELEFVYEKEIAPELFYLFKHYLTQEAAYNSILIRTRKEMHLKVAAAIEQIYKDSLERYYSVLAQHYEKAAEYRRAFDCYRLAGDKAQGTTSADGAVQLYERGETALQMLHEDRPELRNKLKTFAVASAAGGLSLAIVYAVSWLNARIQGTQFRPIPLPYYAAGGLLGAVIAFGGLAFLAQRWSFLVYPDRIRMRSKRQAIDIPFECITAVQMISYKHRPTPGVLWTETKIYFDPRYSHYGLGQTRVLRGTREIIRVDCAHQKWRKGYYLDMDEPRSFHQTLNRALRRFRLIRGATGHQSPIG